MPDGIGPKISQSSGKTYTYSVGNRDSPLMTLIRTSGALDMPKGRQAKLIWLVPIIRLKELLVPAVDGSIKVGVFQV